jgi:hypothetical protein
LELFGLQGNKGITHGFVLFINVKVSCNVQCAMCNVQSELTNFATKLEVYKLFRNVQSRRTNYKHCECVHANALVILLALIESTNFTY